MISKKRQLLIILAIFIVLIIIVYFMFRFFQVSLTGKTILDINITKSSQKISNTTGNFNEPLDNSDRFGASVTSIGDLNNDNITDIVVGASYDDDGVDGAGAVYVLFMHENGTVNTSQKISYTQGNLNESLDASGHFGWSVSSIGDLDNDNITDIVVGANFADDGGTDRGEIYVLFMHENGTVNSSQKISNTTGNFNEPLDNFDYFGVSVTSIGDLDNDNITDIVVGANYDDDGGANRGAVYVLFMNTNGTVKSSQKISNTTGNFNEPLDNDDEFGISVASIGDLDNDNITDIVVGASYDDDGGGGGSDRGAIYVLFMYQNGTVKSSQKISDTQGNFLEELNNSDYFGASVSSIGDLDNDNITDIVVGANYDDDGGTNRGAGYILFMYQNGTVKSSQKISDTEGNFTESLDGGDNFGISVTSIGDLDNDNITDIVISAKDDDDGGTGRGAVYVLFLKDIVPPTITFSCTPSSVEIGQTITCSCTGTDDSGVNSTSYTENPSTSTAGSFSTTCTIIDSMGNSASEIISYTVTSVGGGGSGNFTPPIQGIHLWTKITPGDVTIAKDFDEELGVKQIQIEVNNEAHNVKITIIKYSDKPANITKEKSGKVYHYLEIETENLDDKLEKGIITLQINKSQVADKYKIALFKFVNIEWTELITVYKEEDVNYYYYDVEVDSFSYFAIGEKSGAEEPVEQSVQEPETSTGKIIFYILIVVLVISIIVVGFLIWRSIFKNSEKLIRQF